MQNFTNATTISTISTTSYDSTYDIGLLIFIVFVGTVIFSCLIIACANYCKCECPKRRESIYFYDERHHKNPLRLYDFENV